MNRLKILLQYDAGTFHHLAFTSLLFILCKTSYIAILLLAVELVFLFKASRRVLIYALVIGLLIYLRWGFLEQKATLEGTRFSGTVVNAFENGFDLHGEHRLRCYMEDMPDIEPGQEVVLTGTVADLSRSEIQNSFDMDLYLASEGFDGAIYVKHVEVVGESFNLSVIREHIARAIDQRYDADMGAYLKLFVLGIKPESMLDLAMANRLGISHLFAISGMHLALFVGLIGYLLRLFGVTRETTDKVVLVFLVIYNVLTGFMVSVLRASLLFIGLFMRKTLGILLSRADVLSFIFVGFLIVNPYQLYGLGFALSFLIAGSLILVRPMWQEKGFVMNVVRTSCLATAVALPLLVGANHMIGLAFIYANLFFIAYMTYLVLPGTLIVLALPKVAVIYRGVMQGFIGMETVFDQINILIPVDFPNAFYKVLYWLFLGLFLASMKQPKRRLLWLFAVLVTTLGMTLFPYPSSTFVRFLAIGQGDAIHLRSVGCEMLIDTGPVDRYDTLIDYLKSYNRHHLDALLITHFHDDHSGELEDLLAAVEIDHLYLNRLYATPLARTTVLKEGDTLACGNLHFAVLNGDVGDINENNNSLVLYGKIGGDRYLFSGDMEASVENRLLNDYTLSFDVLKVPHHGSDTSSSDLFLQMTRPLFAIIPVGKDNLYGFPDPRVLDRYLTIHTTLYRTDLDGTVTFYYWPGVPIRLIETYRHRHLRHYRLSMV